MATNQLQYFKMYIQDGNTLEQSFVFINVAVLLLKLNASANLMLTNVKTKSQFWVYSFDKCNTFINILNVC